MAKSAEIAKSRTQLDEPKATVLKEEQAFVGKVRVAKSQVSLKDSPRVKVKS